MGCEICGKEMEPSEGYCKECYSGLQDCFDELNDLWQRIDRRVKVKTDKEILGDLIRNAEELIKRSKKLREQTV